MSRAVASGVLAIVALTTGCASSRMSDHYSNDLFRAGKYEEAAKRLNENILDKDISAARNRIGMGYYQLCERESVGKYVRAMEEVAALLGVE